MLSKLMIFRLNFMNTQVNKTKKEQGFDPWNNIIDSLYTLSAEIYYAN